MEAGGTAALRGDLEGTSLGLREYGLGFRGNPQSRNPQP